jgi:hypothetical protein
MQHTRARSLRAILLSLVLGAAGASPAFAVETSSSSAESFEVLATITIAGVPANISYGSLNAGQTAESSLLTILVETSNPNGARLEVAATDVSGPTVIPASARTFTDVSADSGGTLGGGAYGTAGDRMQLYSRSVWPAGGINITVRSEIAIPSNVMPGAYTGSLTFYAVTN